MPTPRCMAPIAFTLLLSIAHASTVRGQPEASDLVEGAPIHTVLPVDAIPAIDDPQYLQADVAAAFLKPDEPVLGVTGGGETKAFSLWQLNIHEIVNDVIGGTPVAVTW